MKNACCLCSQSHYYPELWRETLPWSNVLIWISWKLCAIWNNGLNGKDAQRAAASPWWWDWSKLSEWSNIAVWFLSNNTLITSDFKSERILDFVSWKCIILYSLDFFRVDLLFGTVPEKNMTNTGWTRIKTKRKRRQYTRERGGYSLRE